MYYASIFPRVTDIKICKDVILSQNGMDSKESPMCALVSQNEAKSLIDIQSEFRCCY